MKVSRWSCGLLILFFVSLLLIGRVYGQESGEFMVLGGVIANGSQKTSAWGLEYSQAIKEPFRFSISYLNEGHLVNRRDGLATQAWAEAKFYRFRLGAGIGPYLYFDTRSDDSISRGLGGIISLDGKWFMINSWFLTARWDYVMAQRKNTNMLFWGVGYEFDPWEKQPAEKQSVDKLRNKITLYFVGNSTMNDHSGNGFAGAIEYRRNLSKHIDGTVSYLNESEERQGGALQIWAVQRFFDERLSLGIGGGVYEVADKHFNSRLTTNGIFTAESGYRLYDNWEARVSFSRVVAPHSRDSDLVLAGLGLKF